MKTILLAGGTGLIGAEVIGRVLRDPAARYRIVAPTRREIGFDHPNLINPVLDLTSISNESIIGRLRELGIEQIDVYASCLGSTIRKAGSKAMFQAVDHALVLRFARIALAFSARQALLVSSVGADPRSGVFYLKVKGETERDLAQLDFARVDILRPAQLLGDREEFRPAEWLAQHAARLYSRFLKGAAMRYHPIAAADVAAAMVSLIGREAPGLHAHLHGGLIAEAAEYQRNSGRT